MRPPCLPPLACLQNEAALAEFTQRLKTFRPAVTVLEAAISSVKSTFTSPLLEADQQRTKSNQVRPG